MNLAKISSNGQITVPIEIRRLLSLKSGDKLLFMQNQNGEIIISNASQSALRKAQNVFSLAAADMGIKNEADVQMLIDEMRHGKE